MSSLSIVVPRLGADALFETTLASILRYRMPHHQVIVVQSDLQADTWGLEREVDFVEVAGKPNLARYFNRMLEVANGEVINLVRPGIEVTHQWFCHGIRYLQTGSVGSVACSLVSANYRDQLVSCGLRATRTFKPVHATNPAQKPVGPSTWAAYYRKELLLAMDRLDESISDEFVGLDLALSLRSLGFSCGVATERVLTIASEELLDLPLRPQMGTDAQRMVNRHLNPEQRGSGALVALANDFWTSFLRPARWAQVAGRLGAKRNRASDQAFRRRMMLAKQELAGSRQVIKPRKAA